MVVHPGLFDIKPGKNAPEVLGRQAIHIYEKLNTRQWFELRGIPASSSGFSNNLANVLKSCTCR